MACLFSVLMINGQVKKQVDEVKVTPPKFMGELFEEQRTVQPESDPISTYLSENVEYPKRSQSLRKEGTEIVQFVVTAEGALKNFEIINSVSADIDEELITVLKSTNGMWTPGMNSGVAVEMKKEVSMVFCLGEYRERTPMEKFRAMAINYFNKGNRNLLVKNNPEKALKQFNKAITYLPKDEALLLARGMVKYELGDYTGSQQDWDRLKHLASLSDNERSIDFNIEQYSGLKGFTAAKSSIED